MVKFIFYASKPELFNKEITHIKFLLTMYSTESVIISDWSKLYCLIPHLHKENDVVFLFVSSNEELERFVRIRECFDSVPMIVVLPDDKTETLQKGMILNPVYFLTQNAEPSQLLSAVNELCKIYESYFDQFVCNPAIN